MKAWSSRKNGSPYQSPLLTDSLKPVAREKSSPLPTETVERFMRSCSRPLPSIWKIWLTAGTCRSSSR